MRIKPIVLGFLRISRGKVTESKDDRLNSSKSGILKKHDPNPSAFQMFFGCFQNISGTFSGHFRAFPRCSGGVRRCSARVRRCPGRFRTIFGRFPRCSNDFSNICLIFFGNFRIIFNVKTPPLGTENRLRSKFVTHL